VDREVFAEAVRNDDTRAALFAVAPAMFEGAPIAETSPRFLQETVALEQIPTLGSWGRGE
jgi:hypothetical protein